MGQEKLYIEKELSWLSFNERVLQEAADKSNPLIERMRFLGIYSNNLDEFYKVRFAELKRRIIISEEQGSTAHSRHLLGKIQARVLKADQEFDSLYNELLLEMARNQIFLINERQLSVNQQAWLRNYFKQYLRQHISPILINRETDLVQFLKDDYTYLAVEIIRGENINYALLEIPSDKVPRFVNLPPEAPRRRKPMILLDNILRYCLDDIFKGFFDYDALNAYSMKMTRDAEYDLVHEMESSLMELMSSSLKQRLTAEPVRFVYQRDMPDAMVEMLRDKLSISNYDPRRRAAAITTLKTLSASRTSVRPIWSISPCRACVICGLINSATASTPFANATCCSTIPITPLSTCWSCCVRPPSTPAYWRSKSTFTAWPRIRALLTR